MDQSVNYKMMTVCLIRDGDKVLLLDRQHGDFQGFIPPGGKIEFPESIVDGAIREVKEETGLDVHHLIFKGIYEYVNPTVMDRHMIFNYITEDFTGELLENGPEGKAVWVHINEVDQLPMQESIRRRFPLFFEEGTFEIQVEWNHKENKEEKVTVKTT